MGGSVRDLLDQNPIAASASPEEIKEFAGTTHRRGLTRAHYEENELSRSDLSVETQNNRDEIIWDDNEFGTVESDAHRRDFTVNALFFCIETERILDFTDGLPDLDSRIIRTIGDPTVRFREDPVRILRAIKFAARLDFNIETQSLVALRQETALLARAAVPRLYEELVRMLRGGAARKRLTDGRIRGI